LPDDIHAGGQHIKSNSSVDNLNPIDTEQEDVKLLKDKK
jgi:hypothetical protein